MGHGSGRVGNGTRRQPAGGGEADKGKGKVIDPRKRRGVWLDDGPPCVRTRNILAWCGSGHTRAAVEVPCARPVVGGGGTFPFPSFRLLSLPLSPGNSSSADIRLCNSSVQQKAYG